MNDWTDLKTDPQLLLLLGRAAKEGMTPAEMAEQRVSWVWSMQESLTKDEVRHRLASTPLPLLKSTDLSNGGHPDEVRWSEDRLAILAALRAAGLELVKRERGYQIQTGAASAGLPEDQEPKYTVTSNAIVNRASGEVIPADEPVFIFRARDRLAARALENYAQQVGGLAAGSDHHLAVRERVRSFRAFASSHPGRMKNPDTAQTKAVSTAPPKPPTTPTPIAPAMQTTGATRP